MGSIRVGDGQEAVRDCDGAPGLLVTTNDVYTSADGQSAFHGDLVDAVEVAWIAGNHVDGIGAVGHGDLPDMAARGILHGDPGIVARVAHDTTHVGVRRVVHVPAVGKTIPPVALDVAIIRQVAGRHRDARGLEVDACERYAVQRKRSVPGDVVRVGDAVLLGCDLDRIAAWGQMHAGPQEDMVGAGLAPHDHAVDGQLHRVQVRVELDVHDIARPIDVAAAGDGQHRIARPIGLVPVEGIFFCLPIVADQALVVAAGGVALVATIDGEIEHVPDALKPEERPARQLLPIHLMECVLVLFRVPAGPRILRIPSVVLVLVDAGSRAVLAQAGRLGRMGAVERIGPRTDIIGSAVVPAIVLVKAGDVSQVINGFAV